MGEDSTAEQVISHNELWGDQVSWQTSEEQAENRTKDISSINHGTQNKALLCIHLIKTAYLLPSKAANT